MSERKNKLKETRKVLFPLKKACEVQPQKLNKSKFIESQFPWLKKSPTKAEIVSHEQDTHMMPKKRAIELSLRNSSMREIEVPAAKRKSTDGVKDQEKVLREKLMGRFSWLEEDSSDFSHGVCNVCQHRIPFKRQNFVTHEDSKKHKKALLLVDQKELQTDSHDVEIVDKAKEPPHITAHSAPSVDCNTDRYQVVNHLYIRNEPLETIISEPANHDNDTQPKYVYCDIRNESQLSGFAVPTLARVADMNFPVHTTPSVECNSNHNQVVNHLYLRKEPLETIMPEPTKYENDIQHKLSYCDVRSNSQLPGFAVPTHAREVDVELPGEDLTKLVANMCSRFSLDLKKLLRRDQQLRNYVTQNKEVSQGKRGIIRLKKILVGHLSQYYLSESTIELWRHDTATQTRENTALNAKLEIIQLQMERSIQELQDLKNQIREKELIDYHII